MTRRALLFSAFCLFLSLWMAGWGGNAVAWAQSGGAACQREDLKGLVDKYFQALEAHNPSILPLASTVRFTENGNELAVGKGFWETAGKPQLKRTLIDTQKCGTHTQAVMEENGRPILYGFRLKVVAGKITEIETIIAREKEFAFKPRESWQPRTRTGRPFFRLSSAALVWL